MELKHIEKLITDHSDELKIRMEDEKLESERKCKVLICALYDELDKKFCDDNNAPDYAKFVFDYLRDALPEIDRVREDNFQEWGTVKDNLKKCL